MSLRYLGAIVIEISLKAPEEKNDASTSVVTEPTQVTEEKITETIENKTEVTTTEENTSYNNGLSEDFKEAMDSYEEFMNEYVEFMKKYNENATDITLIS